MSTNIVPVTPANVRSGCTRMNSRYALTKTNVGDLLHELETATFLDNLQLLFNEPIENIVSLIMFPFDVTSFSTAWQTGGNDHIIINVVTMNTTAEYLGDISMPLVDLGSLNILRYYDNFLDYAPYTKLEIYLPYIGFETLDVDLVMGKTINVKYAIDLYTGKCTAYVSVVDGNDEVVILIRDGQCGMPIQIAGGSGGELSRNMLKAGLGIVGGLPTAGNNGFAGGSGFVTGSLSSTIEAGKHNIHKGGHTEALNAFYAPQKCYVIRTAPVDAEPTTYAHNVGYPSGKTATLGDLTGFTVVDTVHVEGAGFTSATEEERAEIERLLKTGVIL